MNVHPKWHGPVVCLGLALATARFRWGLEVTRVLTATLASCSSRILWADHASASSSGSGRHIRSLVSWGGTGVIKHCPSLTACSMSFLTLAPANRHPSLIGPAIIPALGGAPTPSLGATFIIFARATVHGNGRLYAKTPVCLQKAARAALIADPAERMLMLGGIAAPPVS